jgi:hypothetical protein
VSQLLSRANYHKYMVDKNGESLYPVNNDLPSSSNHPGPMVLHCELDLFLDTLVVSGCSKRKRLKVNPRHISLSHYVMTDYPKLSNLVPPTVVKDPIED